MESTPVRVARARSVSPSPTGRGVCVDPACGSPNASCICALCVCGQHCCPQKPEHFSAGFKIGVSAYRQDYPAHAIEPRVAPAAPAAPTAAPASPLRFDARSTYGVEYTEKPLSPSAPAGSPTRAQQDYEAISRGPFYGSTTSGAAYTAPMPQAVPSPRHPPRAPPPPSAPFSGVSAYAANYVAHPLPPREAPSMPSTSFPPTAPFAASSTYAATFVPHDLAAQRALPAQSRSNALASSPELKTPPSMPFTAKSSHALDFVPHAMSPRRSAATAPFAASGLRFDGATNYSLDYQPCGLPSRMNQRQHLLYFTVPRPVSADPSSPQPPPASKATDSTVNLSEGLKFSGESSYNREFVEHALPEPCPAARLPAPPTTGGAWEKDDGGKDHVLWDGERKAWATN
jgi:hypothetical protein